MAVFKPETKVQTGTFRFGTFGFPNWAFDQLKDHRDKEGLVFLHSYQMLRTASSVVSPIIVMLKSHLLEI
jgi:hypothetical protein